jgi:hypothetical protein
MFDYLTDNGVNSSAVTIPLDAYQTRERSVSLELVAWKATCLMSTPSDMTFRSILDCHVWIKSGWKALKEETSIGIILYNVASFLDAAWGTKYKEAEKKQEKKRAKTKVSKRKKRHE